MRRREMEWLLCVSDHNVEMASTWQTFPDVTNNQDNDLQTKIISFIELTSCTFKNATTKGVIQDTLEFVGAHVFILIEIDRVYEDFSLPVSLWRRAGESYPRRCHIHD